MQRSDLGAERVEADIVVDDVISDAQAHFPACLGGKNTARLLLGFRVAGQQPAYLRVLVAIDDQYAIDEISERRCSQQRYHDKLIVAAGRFGLPDHLFPDARVQYGFQLFTCVVVRKHELAHYSAVEPAVVADDLLAERLSNVIEPRPTRHDDFASDDIRIDNGCPQFDEQVRDSRFAARDPACQADPQRCSGTLCVSCHLQKQVHVGVLDGIAIQQGDPPGGRQIRTKGEWQLAVAATKHDHRNADDGADNG